MGVVRPPWITQNWFRACPFNYCDHFGNKQRLAEVCIICKEELDHIERCKAEGKDPYSWEETFKVLSDNFAKTMQMITEEASGMGINLNEIDENYPKPPPAENYSIYRLVKKYADYVQRVMENLSEVPKDSDIDLVMRATDAFSHSRIYIIAKIVRALSSKWEEEQDSRDNAQDSKTSALLAYMAVERNSRAALALARHQPLRDLKAKHLKFAKLGLEVADIIKKQFFPKYRLAYKEFGTEEYDQYLNAHQINSISD